jgi:branched-chain amino acid transport system ATP-binding protein
MSAVLEAEGLVAGYGSVRIAHGNLAVEPGEAVALLGPNGAGKTTTLLTVSGLAPARSRAPGNTSCRPATWANERLW